jgi:hypothetical protein
MSKHKDPLLEALKEGKPFKRMGYFIDCGRECVGLAAEILALFEDSDPE